MIKSEQLLSQLNWRYATKKFDSARRISDSDWHALEEALILTPSSYGLQPWTFVVVTNQAVKESLVPVSWNQRQIADCSHHVVFAIKTTIDHDHVDSFLERMIEVRGGTLDALSGYRKMMIGDVIEGPRSKIITEWATRQAYIALGNFMTSAAMLGIDTCPMEGFEPARYDEILDLPAKGLASVVACAAGYRAATDGYSGAPKVRFKREDIIHRV